MTAWKEDPQEAHPAQGGQRGQRATQRARLVEAMALVAASEGYANATIAKVLAAAGVSRPTFYEYFTDRDECVIVSARDVGETLSELVAATVEQSPGYALSGALEAHVEFARRHTAKARFLFSETLAGGPRTLDERDRLIRKLAAHVEAAYDGVSEQAGAPDLSAQIVIGVVWRLVAGRIRDEQLELDGFAEDLSGWVARYTAPVGEHRWRTLRPVDRVGTPPARPSGIEAPLRAPAATAPGRPRIPHAEVRENQRQRILAAITEAAKSKGYSATTIADIARLAGVDARVFNSLFSGKREAFLSAHEIGVQATMATAAMAFFVEGSWPERVWAGCLAATTFLEANPLIAHLGFVEADALGADAAKLLGDTRAGFTIFLQEGYQAYPQGDPPSRVTLEAIATAIFEHAYRLTREEVRHGMAGMLASVVHLALTPFMGAEQANRFIDGKLEAG